MENCPHVRQMRICGQTDLLNPRNWSCSDCGTTESVWVIEKYLSQDLLSSFSKACLTCSHFACGRAADGHSVKHFDLTRHPLAIEVNQKYVHWSVLLFEHLLQLGMKGVGLIIIYYLCRTKVVYKLMDLHVEALLGDNVI